MGGLNISERLQFDSATKLSSVVLLIRIALYFVEQLNNIHIIYMYILQGYNCMCRISANANSYQVTICTSRLYPNVRSYSMYNIYI